jgi:hypothetical protein
MNLNIDELTVKQIKLFGFTPLKRKHRNANGPDITAIKDHSAYTFEVKVARVTKRGSLQVPPVEHNRRNDDFILIVLPKGQVIIESMADHLSRCTSKGYRTLNHALL